MANRNVDISGNTYGLLIAIKQVGTVQYRGSRQKQLWECLCKCGRTHVAEKYKLTSGHTKSCGCSSPPLKGRCNLPIVRMYGEDNPSYKHGGKGADTYQVWCSMVHRCTQPSSTNFKNYGGRGITVCDQWKDFQTFFKDMGERPFKGAQLDRIDNNKGYSPDNCRWTTPKENSRNKRTNRLVTVRGVTKTAIEWAELAGIRPQRIYERISNGNEISEYLARLI